MKKRNSIYQHIYRAFHLMLLLIPAQALLAQQPGMTKEITVVAPYEPTISDAFKINLSPSYADTGAVKKKSDYSIKPAYIPVQYNISPLKAASLTGEPLKELYRNYLKAGMGTYTTPYLEYFYGSGRDKTTAYGLHLKHLSSWGDIRDYAYSGYSNNLAGGYVRKSFKNQNAIQFKGSFERNVNHFYGFMPADYDSVPDKSDIKQRFAYIDAGISHFSQHTDGNKIRFNNYLEFQSTLDKYESKEFNLKGGTSLQRDTKFTSLTEKQTWLLDAGVDYFNNRTKDARLPGYALVSLRPGVSTEFGEFFLTAALSGELTIDTATKFHLFPEAIFGIRILEDRMRLTFGIDGGIERNSFMLLSRLNPYVISNVHMNNRTTLYRFYLEFTGRLSNRIDLRLMASTSRIDSLPFFVTDTNSYYENRFDVVFDNLNLLELKAELGYQVDESLKLLFMANFREFALADFTPWHEPTFRSSLTATYNIGDKFYLNAQFFHAGKRFARDYDLTGEVVQVKLDPVFDINLGFEYRYTKLLSAFLNFNNLLGQKYQWWYNYPVQGFSFMGGVTFAF